MQTLVGQSTPHWTDMASLPFAFAAASFLIWSMVQLMRLLFEAYRAANAETVATLRGQMGEQRKFQEDTLVGLIRSVSDSMNKDAIANESLCEAWGEVHEDFRSLIGALRVRPCLHDSDLPAVDEKSAEIIRHRQERNERNSSNNPSGTH
jgi:hypothetical protein